MKEKGRKAASAPHLVPWLLQPSTRGWKRFPSAPPSPARPCCWGQRREEGGWRRVLSEAFPAEDEWRLKMTRRRLVLALLCLTVLSPIFLYTDRLSASSNPSCECPNLRGQGEGSNFLGGKWGLWWMISEKFLSFWWYSHDFFSSFSSCLLSKQWGRGWGFQSGKS